MAHGHGRVVCSNSHRCLGHGDGRERPPTAQSIELRPFRDRSDGQTARGRAHPTRPPLTRPLTRPYRPVQLRCSQLSTVSKCCAPANLTHCRGRDSGGMLTVRVQLYANIESGPRGDSVCIGLHGDAACEEWCRSPLCTAFGACASTMIQCAGRPF